MKRDSGLGVVGRLGTAARLGAVMGLGLLAGTAAAEDAPRNLTCSFASGASWSYENGTFNSKPSQPLSFSIEDIDLEKQAATLKTAPDAKGGKLSVVRAINANHFLEVVNEGFLNLTTVYDKDAATGKHPAVHSRHFGLLGSPVFGQYTGYCSDK